MKRIDAKTFEILVLAAWAHDEISIGRARELLGWKDSKIREQAEKRVSNAATLKEERDGLSSQVDWFQRLCGELYTRVDELKSVLQKIREIQGCECDEYHSHRCLVCRIRAIAADGLEAKDVNKCEQKVSDE